MCTKSVSDETYGVITIRKQLGNQLFSMKLRQFKLVNVAPSSFLGLTVSPSGDLIGFAFLFQSPHYSVPYISFLLLRTPSLVVLRNKIKLKLTNDILETLQKSNDLFSFCITPPLCNIKSSYLIVKIGKSMMIISIATSTVLRTTLNIHEYTRDPDNPLFGKHVSALSGRLSCQVYGTGKLVVYGKLQPRQLLVMNLVQPSVKQTRDQLKMYYQTLGRANVLSKVVDPGMRRLLTSNTVQWGKLLQSSVEAVDTIKFMKQLLVSLIGAVFDSNDSYESQSSHRLADHI